jgi:hypothetical protein
MPRIRLILVVAIEAALVTLLIGASITHGSSSDPTTSTPATPTATSPATTPPPPGKEPRDRGRDRDEGPGRQGGMRVAPMFLDVTPEDVTKIMAFVGENMPWLKDELEKTRDSDATRFRQECRNLRFDMMQLERLKAADPDAFKGAIEERRLRFEAHELAVKIRAATDPDQKKALTAQLRQQVDKLFDVETATRKAQIHLAEVRLEALRKDLKDREAVRPDIVNKRVDDMVTGRADASQGPGDSPPPQPRPESRKGPGGPPPSP